MGPPSRAFIHHPGVVTPSETLGIRTPSHLLRFPTAECTPLVVRSFHGTDPYEYYRPVQVEW